MKLQNKQQRNMEENSQQRMKHFVLVDHIHAHLLLSKAVFCALLQQCLQNCNASARAGLLRAVQYFGWEHRAAEGKGEDHGS